MYDAASALSRELAVHPLVARVLVHRGVREPDAARGFLSPRLGDLTRPDAMADRDAAADRLAAAVRGRERIVVFGDYDVDGITATALLTRALRALGGDVQPLVASRFDGGYGLSDAALDRVLDRSPSVLVTCDCGTSDHPRLERARRRGVDVIVVDHHKVPEEPLPVVAFLNPHRPECGFPYKGMASVGLAFSIVAAVRSRLGVAHDLKQYLDLVALGTIADVAPLDGDNRTMTRHGLDRISEGFACPGVRALVSQARLRYRIVAKDVGFSLGPMLNAPGRLGAATPTLELLLAENDREATARASVLAEANTRRREISAELVEVAFAQAHAMHGDALPTAVVVAGQGWHAGMGGIIAGRLVDRLGVPVCVVSLDGEEGTGSVRAPRGAKLYDALKRCAGDLLAFGGHDAAAGVRLRTDRMDAFRAAFANAVTLSGGEQQAPPTADCLLTERDLEEPFVRDLHAFEPTGEGNPEIVARLADARVTAVRTVREQHLSLSIAVGRRTVGGFVRDGVALRARGVLGALDGNLVVEGAVRPDPWRGPEAVQLDVRSISR